MKFQKFGEATKDLSPKQKREYIWMYYKWHIIGSICVVLLGIYSYYEFANRQEPFVQIVLTGGNRGADHLALLQTELNEALLPEGQTGYTVVLNPLTFSMAEGGIASVEEAQVVMLLLSVGEMDVVVVDAPTLEHFVSLDGLVPVQDFGIEVDPEALVYVDGTAFGIRGEHFPAFDPILAGGEWIVAFGVGTPRTEGVLSFLEHSLY